MSQDKGTFSRADRMKTGVPGRRIRASVKLQCTWSIFAKSVPERHP
jgi:hypothetical protein